MRFPFMLMFTTRLVVVARKLKRRVHAFIESIDTCHRDFIEFAYSNSTSGAKVFDDVSPCSKIGSHPRGASFEHSVSRFDNFSLRFGLLFSLFSFLSLARTDRILLSSRERNFLPFVHSVGHAALRAHQIITRNVLSDCHGIIIAMYVAFLSRKDFAI